MGETWRPIEGFDPYEVSDKGRVRNGISERILSQHSNGERGFIQVVLQRDGKSHARAVHRLVAEAFLEDWGEGYSPIPIDGDRSNLAADNLEWVPKNVANMLTRQKKRTISAVKRPIIDLETEEIYDNSLHCANELRILEAVVYGSAQRRVHDKSYGRFEFYYD